MLTLTLNVDFRHSLNGFITASSSLRLSSQKLPRNLSAISERRCNICVAFSFVFSLGSWQKFGEVEVWEPLLHLPGSGFLPSLRGKFT
jgi:hypothetical protein